MSNVTSVLNHLIETSKDGQKGFNLAAENTNNNELKALFSAKAIECESAARELQNEVVKLGGAPETDGSISGAMHRGWMNIKSVISDCDDHALLSECERGEDVAKKHYHDALEKELPLDVRHLIEKQYQGVLQTHDRVKALRDSYATKH